MKYRKVLFIAYYYPPSGGAGVQRTVKFIKYLPTFGFIPVVVCSSGTQINISKDDILGLDVSSVKTYSISFNRVENIINKLLSTKIGRWFRSQFYIWEIAAKREVTKAIKIEKPDVVYVTVSPFPAADVGIYVAKKFKIPWVLDLRDPWALDPITTYQTIFHYYFEIRKMRKALSIADKIIVNTPSATKKIKSFFNKIEQNKFVCITNGWDRNDFVTEPEIKIKSDQGTTMKIVHTGVFHTSGSINKSRLFSILKYSTEPINLFTRTPKYLFEAYANLIKDNKLSKQSIKFIFAGNISNEDYQLVKDYQLEENVIFHKYLDHKQSVELLHTSDVLFLPLHELKNKGDPLIVPGKTYEYLAAQKPILATVPDGDAREIIMKSGLGFVCEPSNIEQIENVLLKLYIENSQGGISVTPDASFINLFERKILTQKLSAIFSDLIKN